MASALEQAYADTEKCMLYLGGVDNSLIHTAEAYLKTFLATPASGIVLFMLIQSSGHELVRQLAGVLLRRKIIALYNRFAPAQRVELKAKLLERLANEPARPVRKAIVSVVAALGKALMPAHNWVELETILVQCATHHNDEARELAMILLRELSEGIGPGMIEFAAALRPMFATLLGDAVPRVRIATLHSVGHMLSCLNGKKDTGYGDFIPAILELTRMFALSDEGGVASETLDVLTELTQTSSTMIKPHIEALVRTALLILTNTDAAENIRALASEIVIDIICSRPKVLLSKGLVLPILDAGMALQIEIDPEEEREREHDAVASGIERSDYMDDSAWCLGGRVIDSLCLNISGKKLYGPLVERVQAWVQRPEWQYRHAGVMTLATSVQGLRQDMVHRLDTVLDFALKLARDPVEYVRESVGWCLAQLAEYTSPFIYNNIATFLPACMLLLDDPSTHVAERVAHAIENFTEALEKHQIKPYVQPLLTKLTEAMARESETLWLKETAVASISSICVSAGDLILPWMPQLIAILQPSLHATDERALPLRAMATECLGHIAVAAGKQAFAPYVVEAMDTVTDGLKLEHSELTENVFIFYGCMAEVLGEELGSYVDVLVKLIMLTIASSEGVDRVIVDRNDDPLAARLAALTAKDVDEAETEADGVGNPTEGAGATAAEGDGGEGEDEEEDDDDEGAGTRSFTRIHTSIMNVKCAAYLCLGKLAAGTGRVFAPYVPRLMPLLEKGVTYFHDPIRADAVLAIQNVVRCLVQAYPPIPPVVPGGPMTLQPDVQVIYNSILTLIIQVLQEEESLEVTARACVSIQNFCKLLGLAAVANHHEAVMKALHTILKEKAPCQLAVEDREEEAALHGDDDGADDEDAEHDYVLMDDAVDAVVEVARAMGPLFSHYAPGVMKTIMKFTKPSRSINDRAMAIGFFGDVAQAVGEAYSPWVPSTMEVLLAALRDADRDIRRNACFCAGVYIARCTGAARPFVPHILQALQPLLQAPRGGTEDDEGCLDNAAAALARAMTSVPDMIPMDIAVPAFLAVLPLRSDFTEHHTIFETMFSLLQAGITPAVAAAPAIVGQVVWAFSADSTVPADVRAQVIVPRLKALLLTGHAASRAAVSSVIEALPAPQREQITTIIAT